MADYYPLISKAVKGLDENSEDARRALYERARAVLASRLGATVPALSALDIFRERAALEEAIKKVESVSTRSAAPSSKSAPPVFSPPQAPKLQPVTQPQQVTPPKKYSLPLQASKPLSVAPPQEVRPPQPAISPEHFRPPISVAPAQANKLTRAKLVQYVTGIVVGLIFVLSAYGQEISGDGQLLASIRQFAQSLNDLNHFISYRSMFYVAGGGMLFVIALHMLNERFISYVRGFFVGFGFYPLILTGLLLVVIAGGAAYLIYVVVVYLANLAYIILSYLLYYPMLLAVYIVKLVSTLLFGIFEFLFELVRPLALLIWSFIKPIAVLIWSVLLPIFGLVGTVLEFIWSYVLLPIFKYGLLFLAIVLAVLLSLAALWPVSALGRATTDSFKSVLLFKTERHNLFGQGFALGIAIFAAAGAVVLRGHNLDHHSPIVEAAICVLFCLHVLVALQTVRLPNSKKTFIQDVHSFWKDGSQELTAQVALFPLFIVVSGIALYFGATEEA